MHQTCIWLQGTLFFKFNCHLELFKTGVSTPVIINFPLRWSGPRTKRSTYENLVWITNSSIITTKAPCFLAPSTDILVEHTPTFLPSQTHRLFLIYSVKINGNIIKYRMAIMLDCFHAHFTYSLTFPFPLLFTRAQNFLTSFTVMKASCNVILFCLHLIF